MCKGDINPLHKTDESENIKLVFTREWPMSSETKIASRDFGSKTIVDVDAQNVDFRNCEAIKSAVAGMVAQGHKNIVLNLSKVSFMDSSGLSVILFCKR